LKKFILIFLLTLSAAAVNAQKPKASLNHIAVHVQDLKKSLQFYTNIIQLDTIPEPFHDGKHVWFTIGAHSQLHLIAGATTAAAPNKNTHLCFSVADLQSVLSRLNKAGIAWEDWPGKKNAITTRVDGVQQIYLQDPDGYWIELNNDTY
jgi:lactoylglutathione lyase